MNRILLLFVFMQLNVMSCYSESNPFDIVGPWILKRNYTNWMENGDSELFTMQEIIIDNQVYRSLPHPILISTEKFRVPGSAMHIKQTDVSNETTILLTLGTLREPDVEACISINIVDENEIYFLLEKVDADFYKYADWSILDFGEEYIYIRGEKVF